MGKTIPICFLLFKYSFAYFVGVDGRVVIRLRALVVLPTKDLAIQVAATLSHFIEGTNFRMALLAGQHTFEAEQELFISSKSLVDILICTPGRLVDHLKNTPNFTLPQVEFLVIDEPAS